jgi:hypothetical protein
VTYSPSPTPHAGSSAPEAPYQGQARDNEAEPTDANVCVTVLLYRPVRSETERRSTASGPTGLCSRASPRHRAAVLSVWGAICSAVRSRRMIRRYSPRTMEYDCLTSRGKSRGRAHPVAAPLPLPEPGHSTGGAASLRH